MLSESFFVDKQRTIPLFVSSSCLKNHSLCYGGHRGPTVWKLFPFHSLNSRCPHHSLLSMERHQLDFSEPQQPLLYWRQRHFCFCFLFLWLFLWVVKQLGVRRYYCFSWRRRSKMGWYFFGLLSGCTHIYYSNLCCGCSSCFLGHSEIESHPEKLKESDDLDCCNLRHLVSRLSFLTKRFVSLFMMQNAF